MTITLYSCYHKSCHMISSDIVQPIQVGAACTDEKLPMLQDSEGDNISAKNPWFCELTATYWIWKNATADIVGLFHYRRLLNLRNELRKTLIPNDNILEEYDITREKVMEVMAGYDALIPCHVPSDGKSILQQYAEEHVVSDLELCYELICEKYPQMAQTAYEVLNDTGSLGCFANVIVCRKTLFDEYAAWLFDILFEVERRIQPEVEQRDEYQQRAYGFLAERLMNIFITHKKKTVGLQVCEVPILKATENPREWKSYLNKLFKHKILMALGFKKKTWEENVKSTI